MAIPKLPAWAYLLIAMAPGLAIVVLSHGLPLGVHIALVGASLVWALAFAGVGWHRTDETARTAHRVAWFWGGSLALMLAVIYATAALILPALGDPLVAFIDALPHRFPDGQIGFMLGVMAAAVAQVVGYAVVWTIWWAKRR